VGIKSPPKRLSALSSKYFRLRERFRKQKAADDRLAIQREWLAVFLPVLGYELQPQPQELEDGQIIPHPGPGEEGQWHAPAVGAGGPARTG
jgi:hypothetical protein